MARKPEPLEEKPVRIQVYIPFRLAAEMDDARKDLSWSQFFIKLYDLAKSHNLFQELSEG
jgi:hypothetical protein